MIPVEEARAFVDALRAVSRAPVAYAELPGAQHGFDFFESARARNSAHAVHDFFETVYAANRRPKRLGTNTIMSTARGDR